MAFNRPDIGRFLSELTAGELNLWRSYFDVWPTGPSVQWVQYASMMALLSNVNRDPSVKASPFKLSDFLPFDHSAPGEKPPGNVTFQAAKLWAAQHNARLKHGQ